MRTTEGGGIGDMLRQAIDDSGETRYRLAQRSGLSESALSRFYRGEGELSLPSVDALLEALGLEARLVRKRKARGARQ